MAVVGELEGSAASEGSGIKEQETDWELRDQRAGDEAPAVLGRVLVLSLPKLAPAHGVVVWWQGVMVGHRPTVSIDEMPDRATASQTVGIPPPPPLPRADIFTKPTTLDEQSFL